MPSASGIPNWIIVVLCGASVQLVKLILYSVAQRRFTPAVLVKRYGLPSLPAAVFSCLLVTTVLSSGWNSPEAGFALVIAIIVIHDSSRVHRAAGDQRYIVFHLVESLQGAGQFRARVADYLDARTHLPAHMVVGVVFGVLYALAFGIG